MTPKETTPEARATRGYRKGALILGMIARKKGATAEELARAVKWRKNSVFGFISACRKLRPINVIIDGSGRRRYVLG